MTGPMERGVEGVSPSLAGPTDRGAPPGVPRGLVVVEVVVALLNHLHAVGKGYYLQSSIAHFIFKVLTHFALMLLTRIHPAIMVVSPV